MRQAGVPVEVAKRGPRVKVFEGPEKREKKVARVGPEVERVL